MQIKIAKRNALQRLVLGGCALAIISSTGCKSGMSMPGASMFGWNKGPSAETLAGQGPTTTYPSPPSTEFTPNAVASNAAGTGQPTNSMAGITAGVPNTAATANGFAGATGYAGVNPYGRPTTAQAPTTTQAAPNSFAGAPSYAGTNYGNTPSYPGTPPSYAGTPSNFGAPTTTPAANFAMPNGPSAQVATAAGTPSYGTPSYGGSSGPSFGATGIPAGYTTGGTPAQTNPYTVPTGTMPPTGGAVAPMTTMPGTTVPGTTTGGTMAPGYRPGSTAGATSYPSTPFTSPNATIHR